MLRPHWLLLPVLLTACHAHGLQEGMDLQELTPLASLPTDSSVLARLQQLHPCTGSLPPLQVAADTLPSDVRCILVMTAAAAIQDLNATADLLPDLRQFRLDRVRCVGLQAEAYRNRVTNAVDDRASWFVHFPSDRQPSLTVDIDRRTGVARVFRQLREFGFTADEICAGAS